MIENSSLLMVFKESRRWWEFGKMGHMNGFMRGLAKKVAKTGFPR
jgi:hypothetical protein